MRTGTDAGGPTMRSAPSHSLSDPPFDFELRRELPTPGAQHKRLTAFHLHFVHRRVLFVSQDRRRRRRPCSLFFIRPLMALLPATRQARCPRVTSQIRRSPLSTWRLSARHSELRRSERHSGRTSRKLPAHLSAPVHVVADGGCPSQALPLIRTGPPPRASVARDDGYIRESMKEDSWHSEVLSMPPISAQQVCTYISRHACALRLRSDRESLQVPGSV
ncbi:hypothetical protein C8Q80DRAFT_761896 [Daedaleopsis nitida]|nr:hypothetical protein C8Q80DRAFT_761896 [Daedaleopsis nitida]